MIGADDQTPTPPASAPPAIRSRGPRLPATGPGWIILASLIAVLLVGGTALLLRHGLSTAPGLMFVEARANGLKLGSLGKLRIEGLSGDLWRNFSVRRLTVSDEKGVWLDAADVKMTWRYRELFLRRFHADTVTVRQVRVLRRPKLVPITKTQKLPVSIRIEQLRIPVETLPAFSYRRGLFHVAGEIEVVRQGPVTVALGAASSLHRGDRLILAIESGKGRPLKVFADAMEMEGGALAGSLGLPADQPFTLKANAGGAEGEGRFRLLATSGDTRPAEASGTWNADGGVVSGRVSLAVHTTRKPYPGRHPVEVQVNGIPYPLGAFLVTR